MQPPEPTLRPAFAVMTFNLRFGLADDGPNAWEFRRQILHKLFDDYPVDFYGFQEVNDFQARDLDTLLSGYRSVGKREPAPSFWQNNIIYYRPDWKLVRYRHFFLSPTPDTPSRFRESRWPRQCTIGVFQKGHRLVTCIDTHFDFKASVQAASARIIMECLDRLPCPSPAVLMGDFNAPPASRHFSIFTQGCRGDRRAGERRFKNALPKPCSGTYHGFSGATDGDCIDWILFSGEEIEVVESHVVHDQVGGRYYSDHFPVTATFGWKRP